MLVQQLLQSFEQDAGRIIDKLPWEYNYTQLVELLYKIYDPPGQRQAYQMKLRTLRRNSNESAREFCNKVYDTVYRAYPSLPENLLRL